MANDGFYIKGQKGRQRLSPMRLIKERLWWLKLHRPQNPPDPVTERDIQQLEYLRTALQEFIRSQQVP